MEPAAAIFRPFFIASDGARLRAARFPAHGPQRGVFLVLTGQSEFIEKYFEVIDELRMRGFAVAALDWRGQGGSDRPFAQDPGRIWVADFAEYDADLRAGIEQAAAPLLGGGGKLFALAHSMGGHILLRRMARLPFAAAAISAPMMAIRTGLPPALLRGISGGMALVCGTAYAPGMAKRDPRTLPFGKQIVTSDAARYRRTVELLRAHPQLRVTGPSWGWLAAATRSMAAMARPGAERAIATPVLICDAGNDLVCDNRASARFAARMPHASHMTIADARHEILMERDMFRAHWWAAFDAFMAGQM